MPNIAQVQEKTITQVLEEAARLEGSTQALASRLHAPHATLTLWIAGRAQTPLRAFLAALDFVMQSERELPAPAAQSARPEKVTFPLGRLHARCPRCDAIEFLAPHAAPLRLTTPLACAVCDLTVVHGNLLAQLAKDAVQQSRASTVRAKRAVQSAREGLVRARRRVEESKARVPTPPNPFSDGESSDS